MMMIAQYCHLHTLSMQCQTACPVLKNVVHTAHGHKFHHLSATAYLASMTCCSMVVLIAPQLSARLVLIDACFANLAIYLAVRVCHIDAVAGYVSHPHGVFRDESRCGLLRPSASAPPEGKYTVGI